VVPDTPDRGAILIVSSHPEIGFANCQTIISTDANVSRPRESSETCRLLRRQAPGMATL
jgi:hypothetical protein